MLNSHRALDRLTASSRTLFPHLVSLLFSFSLSSPSPPSPPISLSLSRVFSPSREKGHRSRIHLLSAPLAQSTAFSLSSPSRSFSRSLSLTTELLGFPLTNVHARNLRAVRGIERIAPRRAAPPRVVSTSRRPVSRHRFSCINIADLA